MPEEPKLGDWRAFQASLQADTNNTFLNQFKDSSFRTFSGIDPAPEAKYDQGYYPGMDINQLRINNQSGWDVFENAVQNGLSAIPLEMAESVSNLIAQSWDNNKNEFLEGQNAFGNTMRELKEGIQKSNPIYATDAEKESFNPFSGIDWALNAPSVASTFSLLIPGWGLGRLAGGSVGALTRMAGASAKTMGTASTIAKIGTAAASSRYMENMLEGYGTFQESIGARLLEKGVNPKLIKDTTDLLLANPERALQGSYKDAFKEAADDAAKTVQWNWGAALQDVFQYAMIFGKVKIPSVAPKTALPANSSFLKRSGRFGLKAIDQTRNLLITAASEGIEEGYQYVVGQEALHEGEMFGEGFEQRLSKYLVEEEMKTSMLLGAIMGGGFHAVGNVFEGVMKNYAKNMANTTAAEKAGNIAYQTASQHNQFAYAVKAAYAKNGNLQGVINNVQKIEEGLSKEEKKDNPESVIPLLQTLEEEGNRLKLKGYSAEQIADKISFDFHAALKKSSRIKSINAVKEFANKAITKDSIVEEQVPRFERRAKIDALEKLLKNNTQKLRAQFSSTLNNKLDEYAKELETLKAEDKEDTSPKLRENDYRDIASSEYFSYYLSGLDQAVSRERARRVLKQDPELEKEQKEFQEKAKKQAAKDVAEKIKQAKTPEEVERIKQEEAAINGNTSESDKILNDESENYQTSWDTLLSKTSKEVTFAQALLDTYRDTPLLFLADRAALSKILNRTLPSEASEFVKEIWLTLSTESEQSSAIRAYFQQKDKVGKTDPNGPKDSTSNSPEEDPENPSETIDNAPKYNQIEVVGAQFKWDPETKQVVYDLEGHLIPATNRYSDDPILNYSLLNDVSFAPHAHKDKEGNFVPGWKALLKINPNRTVNKEHTSHQDIAIEIYAVDPKTGKEIFIGHIHRSDRPNAKEPVDNFRKLIYDAYLKEKPTDIYTVPFEAEVEDKMPGHTYNLKIPRDAEHKKVRPKMGSLQAVLKGEPLYLLTTQVKDDAPPMWLGDQNLDKDHPLRDRIAELDIYKHATKGKSTDKRSQLTGGFMFMFLKGLNGKYVTTQIFTKYLHQLPKFQEQVNTLVDQLYETTNKDELEKIVNRIRAIVHVNHLSSNRAIIFKPGEEGKLQPYVVHGVINKANNAPLSEREGAFMSKDALKKTLSETIFYIEGNNINGNYVDESGKLVSFNDMIAERMETDINPDMPLQTTSFTITAKVIPTGVNLDAEPISTTNEGDVVVSTFSITNEVEEELFEKADIEKRNKEEVSLRESLTYAKGNKIGDQRVAFDIIINGNEVGSVSLAKKDKDYYVHTVEINESSKGKGYAGETYKIIAKKLADEGYGFTSARESSMEPEAIRVWEKLVNLGFAVKNKDNSFTYKQQPTSNQSTEAKAGIEKRRQELENKYEKTKERHLKELEKAGVNLGKWGIAFNDIIWNIEEQNNSENYSKEVEALARTQYEEWWALNREKQEIESDANELSFSDYNFSGKEIILDKLKKAISKVYQTNRQALDEGFAEWPTIEREVASVGGNQYSAHGMGKTTIASAFTDLINLFEKGINPFRGQGALDVATLAGGVSDGTTAGGAYMDGAFTLVANKNHNGRIENVNQIGGIIVNEGIATPEVLSALKELFPNLVIESTLNSKSLIEQLNSKYDAELKAVEQQTTTSNQSEIDNIAEIERRRQEEIGSKESRSYTDDNGVTWIVEIQTLKDKKVVRVTGEKNGETIKDSPNTYAKELSNDKIYEAENADEFEYSEAQQVETKGKRTDKINAKYDAELAALERQPTTSTTNQSEIETRKNILLKKADLSKAPEFAQKAIAKTVESINEKVRLQVIERAYEGITATPISKELGLTTEQVRSIRTYYGVPDIADKTEYQNWKKNIDAELKALQDNKTQEKEDYSVWNDIANVDVNPISKGLNIKKAADDHANDQAKPSTIDLTEPTVENVQQEIEYVKRILGSSAVVKAFSKEDQLPNTDTVAELLTNVRRNGQMLEGLFTNAAIYLRNSGTIGRGYHEAFHAVWTLALSETERAKLSNEVRQTVGNSTLSNLEVEEYLAEKFRVQALIPKDNSLSSRLKEVLQGLWSLVKEFFNPHSSINVNRLFKDINQGLYRDKVTFSRNVEQFAKAMATSNKPSNFQLLEFKDVFHDQYHKLIEYLSNHPELKADNIKRSDAELIEIMAASEKMSSLQWLRDRMLYQVLNEINRLEKIGYDTTLWKQARNVYFGGSNHVKKISNSQYTIVKSTPLQTEALYSLNQYGLNLNFSTGELLAIEDVIEDYDDFTSQIFSEESHELPNFLRDRAIENNRLKLRDSIRRSLGNLTKYSLDGLKVSYNSYGVPQREDPKRILSILESQLTNSIDVADMLQRLRKLTNQHNWATELYERAKSDVSFKQDLWLGIGGMASYDYFGVSNRDRVFISNRKTVKFIIRDQLASAFLNRSNPIFNEDGSINIDKAQAHLTRLTAVEAEFAELPSHNVPQERLEELLQTLAKAFRDSYIDIDYETLSQLYSQKGITAFRNTVFTNPGAPITILKEAVTGNNVFTDFDQGSNKDYLSKLGDILRDVWSEQTQQVFMNMKNQRNYSVTEPSYLSTKIAQLKAGSTTFFNDFFTGTLSQAPIFSQLQQANFRDTLKIQILDGADYGEKKSYKELTKEELQRVFIDASLNGGSDKKTTLVPIPIPADSSMLPFIRFQKLNRIEALDNLYQLAIMEQKRINNFKANPDLDNVKNYGKRAGTFVYLTFLNDAGITDVVKQHKKVNELIANHFDELVNETFKEFKVTYAERHTNYTQAEVQSFIYNHVYYSSQIIAMFSKDPSFYKSVGDAFKRYKQLGAPGITGSEFANTKLKSLIVADEEILVDKDFLKILQDLAYKDVATQDKLAQADNTSDGFTFVSEDFYRKFCKAVGKWSVDQELTYQQIQAGKKSIPSHKLRDLYPPIKPYYFSDYDYAGERIPFQMKNSIHVLTDDMIAKYPNSEALVAVKEFLNGDLDMVSFDSTIKVGGFKIYEEVEGVEGPKNKTLKNISDSNWQNAIIEMNLSDLRWQQDNPPHWFEYHIRFGSQLRALITSGLKLTEDYQVGNTTMTGLEVRNLYFDLLETELQEAKENFEEGFNDSERPYEKLLDRIITMARDRNLPNSSIAALNNMTIDREGREIPDLASSATNELSQSILSSLYKRKVWTQEMPGGQFVNVSSFGVSNQLKYDVTPEGVINMEVLLPAWTKELIKVDIKDIKDSEVLNLLGYRIPTEGKYSMFNMKVVGFLPQESGGSIIMPKEVTKIAGLDFDIDKLFVFTPNHERVEGTIKAIKFDYTKNNENDSFNLNQPKAARQNAIIQIIRGILQSKYHAAELLGGGSFARLESISHAHYLKNEFPNLSYEKLISMKDKATEVAKMESKLYNAIYPATQVEFHERGATGESLIGLTANHRTHAAKSELTRLRLIEDITINGITTGTLNLFEGANGLIGKNLEQFTSAMVDNGKNPIAPFINFNSHTAHTAMLLIRLGYSIEFTTAFINNKVVRDLVKTANTDRVSLGSAIYDELRAQDLKPLTQLNVDLSEEDLFRDTASPFVVLQTLEFLYVRASELGRLVTSTKTDAKAAEGNVARLEMQLNAINTAKENKYTYLLNAADFFNPEYSRLTNMFYEAGYAPVVKNHKVFFPELQTSFKRVKDEIESFLPTGVYLNEAKIASINTQLQNFWMANHPIINSLEGAKQEFVQDVFNRLVEAKRNSNSKYLPFLGKLDTKSLRSSKHLVLDRIELYRTNLDETSIDFYRNLWWDMWQNGTAEESKLAKDLFKYSLITSGESNTYSTFKNLAHPIMYLEGDTRSLATHKSKLIQQDIHFNTSTFYDQYARNTHQEPISAITTISSKNLIIRNDRQALQLDTSHPRHLDKNKQPVLYVRVYNSEKYTYELYKDSGEIWGTGTKYVRVNPLGVPNYSYEYSPLNKYIESEFQKAVTLKNEKRGTVDNTPTPGDLEKKYNPKEETSSNEISDTESISLRNGTLITKAELRAMKSEDLHALLENAGYTPLEIGELLRRIC
jgi:hypothetical protein